MTASDTSAGPVTVEVPSHESKESEGLAIDTAAADSTRVEDTAEPTHVVTTEDANAEHEASHLPQKAEEEAKDDEEEQEAESEERIPADIASQRRMEQEKEIETAGKEVIEPMRMLKKGATAVVGGTMVGVGLVMIPLPTPMGCVVASSGLAVLGSEFEGAKEMNDRIIEKSKGTLEKVRDKAIQKIESLNSNDDDTDDESVGEDEEAPAWLKHMNEAERKRQKKLLKQKYRDENKSTNEQLKEYVTKRTGSFLSRNILPALNRTKNWGKEEEVTAVEGEEGTPETNEQAKEVGSPISIATSESFQKGKEKISESFQKGKEQMQASFSSESIQRGKEQMRASLSSTSASFSSMVKRISPQAADEKTPDFDEEIDFDEKTEANAAAFDDGIAAPVTDATATISAAEPAAASVVAI